MSKIGLIADSCCDLTPELLKKYHIQLFPLRIIYSDREYLDKVNITPEEMYASLKTEIPTTSLPDLHYCEQVMDSFVQKGYTDLIVVTISSNLSGTLNSLKILSEHYPSIHFHFFDSKTLGFPQGVLVIEAAKLIERGLSCEDVLENLETTRSRVHGFIAPATLEYLRRGGRIHKATAAIGEVLHIRPIISYNDEGFLYTYAKARGQKQAFNKLRNTLKEYLEKGPCNIWILHGDAIDDGMALYESVKELPNVHEISFETIGPSMGIHTGPGVIGFALIELN